MGSVGEGVEIGTVLGGELTFAPRLAAVTWLGLQRRSDGAIDPRDAIVGVSWIAVSEPTLVVRVQPGLNLPTGGLGSQLYFTPLSTASVDPTLTADVVYGATWLVGVSAVSRISLYDGWDRRRQGAFVRADLRLARRLGVLVPWVGTSAVDQLPSDPEGSVPRFGELAATVGTVVNLADRWSLTGQLRVPLWRSSEAELQVSGGLSVRWVVGPREHGPDE